MNLKNLLPTIKEETVTEDLNQAFEKEKKSLAGFFVKKFRITYLILGLIICTGFYAIATLPKEAEPEIRVPYAVINTSYPGANPTDVEELITDKIEEKIKNIDDLKEFSSTSGVGMSSIFVEFNAEADVDDSIRELKDAVDEAKPDLPEDANDPVTTEINFNDIPIVTYSLVGDYNDYELKAFADILEDEFEAMSDVSKAPIIGGVEREYQVLIDQTQLARFGMSLNQIVGSIQQSNMNLPSGDIDIDGYTYNVRVKGKFEDVKDLSDIIVSYYDDAPIYLKDIGTILDTSKEQDTKSRIGIGDTDPSNTVSIQIYKKTGGNILDIVKNAQTTVDELYEKNIFPADLSVVKTNDNSVFIKEDISRLGTSGIQTMILIVLILFAVLGLRGSIITGLSVPIAFLMAFIVIMLQGMTINSMVLFSLVLSLGLMVDNAIIVMEGINEYIYKHDKTPYEAAILSIWNYKWPIISGTMTTVGAFLPMLLVSGIMGEYIGILPKTITATLVSSLFTALIIIPALSARFYKRVGNGNTKNNDATDKTCHTDEIAKKKKHFSHRIRAHVDRLQVHYVRLLRNILPDKKKRRRIIWSALGLMIATIMLPVTGIMKVEMFPKVDIDYFAVTVELPTGSELEKTSAVATKAENIVRTISELDNYVTSLGSGFSAYAGNSGGSGDHIASITVNLVPENDRDRPSYEIADSVREDLESITGGIVRVEELSAGPPTGAPFEAKIFGDDINTLTNIAEDIKHLTQNIDGLINVEDTAEESSGEFTFTIDRERVTYYGLDVTSVALAVRQAIYGAEATSVTINGEDIDVTVKYNEDFLQDASDLENILLTSATGAPTTIRQVADLSLEPSIFAIDHVDGDKVIRVTAQTEPGTDLRKVMSEFNERLAEYDLPEGYKVTTGGETEDIQQSFTEIFLSLFIGIFIIAFILILQFNSFKQPLVILFSFPLAIVGAFFGLTVLRLGFSLPAFIGIVSLIGIVVNDSIVLIDRINKNLYRKIDFFDSVIEAGLARMQPIFLTSVTTILGVLPLSLSDPMWAGLGFGIIFGLMFATVLTLIFIPVVYTSICHKDHLKKMAQQNS